MAHVIYKLSSPLIEAKVVKRPSAVCKSPYVADVAIGANDTSEPTGANDTSEPTGANDTSELAHSPSLGCSGHVEAGCSVMMEKKCGSGKCAYSIDFSIYNEPEKNNTQLICVNPKHSEKVVGEMLRQKWFTSIKPAEVKAEQKYGDSRFDYMGLDENGAKYILEVKHVPLADYYDCFPKEKKKMPQPTDKQAKEKIAYFPDGFRKKLSDPISPRALKHVNELREFKQSHPDFRAIMCFVIPRTDVSSFQASNVDPIYKQALKEAYDAGVEIIPLVVKWTPEGECIFITDTLPINI
jgi:DNA-binding sugar fermentation-stimulating protein